MIAGVEAIPAAKLDDMAADIAEALKAPRAPKCDREVLVTASRQEQKSSGRPHQ